MDILTMIELVCTMVGIAVGCYHIGHVNGYDKGLLETEWLLLSSSWVPAAKDPR